MILSVNQEIRKRIRSILFVLLVILVLPVSAQIVVLYPEKKSSQELLYSTTVKALKKNDPKIVTESITPQKAISTLDKYKDELEGIIVLGEEITKSISNEQIEVPVVAGALEHYKADDETINSLSIYPSSNLVIEDIKKLNPNINTILTVVSDDEAQEYVEKALPTALKYGIKIQIKRAENTRDVARQWLLISNSIEPKTQAAWISDRRFLKESKSFGGLLKKSWKRRFLLASTIASHAPRGITLGYVPGFNKYAMALLQMLKETTTPPYYLQPNVIETIVNERTLNHIGRRLPENHKQFIDMVISQ